MAQKSKLPREKKKKIKRKEKFLKKDESVKDFTKNEDSLTLSKESPQNFESPKPSFVEAKKLSEQLTAPQKKEKDDITIFHPNKYLLFEIVGLLLITVIVYAGTLHHSFHFDDYSNILQNPFIQISTISVDELVKAGFESLNSKRPVANISFALNYYFHGLDVKGYHIVNIIIHLLAGIVLYYFVKITLSIRLARDKFDETWFIPFFTALIWLVHPLHTQSVTYIVQRMNSMASMFFIMAMLFYVKGRLTPERMRRVLFFIISFIAGILAFGSKENTATLPLFILLYEWYFFQDLRLKISRQQLFWVIAIGLMFVFVLYFFLGSSPLSKLFPDYGSRPFTMAQRLLTQPRVVLHYILLIFHPEPSRLNLDYDFPLSYSLVSPITTLLSILVIVGMLGLAIYTAKKKRMYSFCILWFLGNLVIESSIIPLEIIFEHRTYLPSMMLMLLIVIFFYQNVKNRKVLIVGLVSVTLLFSYWSYERNKIWKDELTLWSDNHKKSPDKARVNLNLGKAYMNSKRDSEAIPFLHEGLRLYEQEVKFQQNVSDRTMASYLRTLGKAYREKREIQKAIFYLQRAIEVSDDGVDDVFTYHLLGQCYGESMRPKEAIYYFSKALELARIYNDVRMQATVSNTQKLLNRANKFLRAQQKRSL